MVNATETGVVTSVGELGIDHEASFERSYWNDPEIHTRADLLIQKWHEFLRHSQQLNRRRAMMRTYVSAEVLEKVQGILPIEALAPVGGEYLIYIGQNRHEHVSPVGRDVLPNFDPNLQLPEQFYIDKSVTLDDLEALFGLWQLFGWKISGVVSTILDRSKPLVVIRSRDNDGQVVGVMLAEKLQLGHKLLIEITELSVSKKYRRNGLASVLIKELTQLMRDLEGYEAFIYGEFCRTTGSNGAAALVGNVTGSNDQVPGILRDHVSINAGTPPNRKIKGYSTENLHDFQFMYDVPRQRR